ncbi:RNA polymerase II subunit A C-terminal domain phosphatase SSU72-like [Sturnira hondurensis]|uniref:RNA polymerase II subunit A C-terminal domain phosphatase SSU72-like n=1 Tax=Sturnira hondurensis TaxID=192404 RepID=UPI00187A201E|nr:RNA polymerase II subunit A C-terminal domain phosphatase SSU72-like [Sturnira hondurensis]
MSRKQGALSQELGTLSPELGPLSPELEAMSPEEPEGGDWAGSSALASVTLRVAVVCTSNLNRSMEAHRLLSKKGFVVRSFGTGSFVKIPGPTADQSSIYCFNTRYDEIHKDLVQKDEEFYANSGILCMLERNMEIKPRPERFQNCRDVFDLILTCEEKVYDQVVEELNSREQVTLHLVHVINVNIQDSFKEASLGAFLFSELCQCIQLLDDVDNEIEEVLLEFEEMSGQTFLHTACFY